MSTDPKEELLRVKARESKYKKSAEEIIAALKKDLAEAKERIAILDTAAMETCQKNSTREEELETRVTEMAIAARQASERIAGLEAAANAARDRNSELETQVAGLKKKLKQAENDAGVSERTNKNCQEKLKGLEKSHAALSVAMNKINSFCAEYRDLAQDAASLRRDIFKFREEQFFSTARDGILEEIARLKYSLERLHDAFSTSCASGIPGSLCAGCAYLAASCATASNLAADIYAGLGGGIKRQGMYGLLSPRFEYDFERILHACDNLLLLMAPGGIR